MFLLELPCQVSGLGEMFVLTEDWYRCCCADLMGNSVLTVLSVKNKYKHKVFIKGSDNCKQTAESVHREDKGIHFRANRDDGGRRYLSPLLALVRPAPAASGQKWW